MSACSCSPNEHGHLSWCISRGGVPRRAQSLSWSHGEHAIREAVRIVEGMGASPRLTAAVILLQQAQNAVADYVDGHPETPVGPPSPPPSRTPQEEEFERRQGDFERLATAAFMCAYGCGDADSTEEALRKALAALRAFVNSLLKDGDDAAKWRRATTALPVRDLHEDEGDVLLWTLPVQEPPYGGSSIDDAFLDDRHTHFTPLNEIAAAIVASTA